MGNYWQNFGASESTLNSSATMHSSRRDPFGDVEEIVRKWVFVDRTHADTEESAIRAMADTETLTVDGQDYAAGTNYIWVNAEVSVERPEDSPYVTIYQRWVRCGDENVITDANARLVSCTYQRDAATSGFNGGNLNEVIRHWPNIRPSDGTGSFTTDVETRVKAVTSSASISADGWTFTPDNVWLSSYIEMKYDNNLKTFDVMQVVRDPLFKNSASSPAPILIRYDDDDNRFNQKRVQYHWPRLTHAAAQAIMANLDGLARPTSPVNTTGQYLYDGNMYYYWARVSAVEDKNDDGTANFTVTYQYDDQNDGDGAIIYQEDYTTQEVEKQYAADATDGYRWRIVVTERTLIYTTSRRNCFNKVSDGLTGTTWQKLSEHQWIVDQVTAITPGDWSTEAYAEPV